MFNKCEKNIDDERDRAILESFDYLLVFFGKLEYLLKIQLIKRYEIFYFRSW